MLLGRFHKHSDRLCLSAISVGPLRGNSQDTSPPEGGEKTPQGGPLRVSRPALRAAPRALPGRGLAPPDPLGCAPWRAFAHRAPAALVTQPEGFRARVRRWRGWASRRLVHARRLAPGGFRASGKFQKVGRRKALRGVRGACPPCQWSGGQPVNGRWAVRVQPPGCARRPRAIGLSTAERVQGTAVEAVWPAAGAPTPASKN